MSAAFADVDRRGTPTVPPACPGGDVSTDDDACGVVFAPQLFLTVSVEGGPGGDEVHLHAGGQGFWVGQLMRELDTAVTLVAPVGGETGTVLGALATET